MAHKVRSPYIYVESKNDGYTIYIYDAITAQNHVIRWSREKSVNIVFLEKDTLVVLILLHFSFQKWNTDEFFSHFVNVVNFGLLSLKI